jgi:hypothetical protein
MVVGEPIRVPADADAQVLEQARSALERALNAAMERAHAVADRRALAAGDGMLLQEQLEIERRVSNNGLIGD